MGKVFAIPAQAHVFAIQDIVGAIAQQSNVLMVARIKGTAIQIQEHAFVMLDTSEWIALKRT